MAPTESRKPVRFGKYTLIDRIAVGGMAEIFLARQAGLEGFEKNIVIKRIRPHLSKEPNFVRMFLNEAKLAAQLNHPNIVQIYDLGKIGESHFIAMEYIFGIAKAANQLEQTRAGEIKGKLSYMSPEQCVGKPLDNRSDLFSLGTVLYEWLTGFRLFTGDSEVAVLKSITEGKIYAPSYFKADIPEAVERILMKALEKDRELRYQTAWEMQFDIDRFLTHYEFTPSNIHLSNFLKQLFFDELEEEQGRLATYRAVATPEEPALQLAEEIISSSEIVGAPPGAADRVVTGKLTAAELDQLTAIARRHGLSVEALVRELVTGFLKYR